MGTERGGGERSWSAAPCDCDLDGAWSGLAVEQGPRLAVDVRCPRHGPVTRRDLAVTEIVEHLARGVERPPRWSDLATATLCTALVAAASPTPTLVVDGDGHAVFANLAWSALTGLSGAASGGQRWLSALRTRQAGTLVGAVTAGTSIHVSLALGPGRATPWVLVPQRVVGADGQVLGHIVVLATDLTAIPVLREVGPPHEQPIPPGVRRGLLDRIGAALQRRDGTDQTIAITVVQVEGDLSTSVLPTGPGLDPLRAVVQACVGTGDVLELGGGCFAVVTETGSYGETLRWAVRLVQEVQVTGTGGGPALRASAGVAFPHFPRGDAESVLADAERALALARSIGGGRVEAVIGSGPGSSDARDDPEVVDAPRPDGSGHLT